MVKPPSAGGLTSRITSLSLAMTTLSPAAGTLLSGQVAGSDQRASWAMARGAAPSSKQTGKTLRKKGMSKRVGRVSKDTCEQFGTMASPK